MSEHGAPSAAAAACARLLAIAEAQAEALANQDVSALVELTSERGALTAAVEAAAPWTTEPRLRAVLTRVAALDEQNLARARDLLQATEQQLRRVRHGQVALRGYSRPGAYLAERPSRLDRQG
ncbi:MAG TPA: hypothetical protein VK066_23920 [Chloroflexota bacterium]|nr:hypothetical protein [Chloroflexota bacterium]